MPHFFKDFTIVSLLTCFQEFFTPLMQISWFGSKFYCLTIKMLHVRCTCIYKFGNNTYPRRIRRRSNLGHIFQGKKCVLWTGKYGTYRPLSLRFESRRKHVVRIIDVLFFVSHLEDAWISTFIGAQIVMSPHSLACVKYAVEMTAFRLWIKQESTKRLPQTSSVTLTFVEASYWNLNTHWMINMFYSYCIRDTRLMIFMPSSYWILNKDWMTIVTPSYWTHDSNPPLLMNS
jgi:hypothetical protein